METNTSRKKSIYLPQEIVNEITEEAKRQGRSVSWIIQQAWRLAKAKIAELPSDE